MAKQINKENENMKLYEEYENNRIKYRNLSLFNLIGMITLGFLGLFPILFITQIMFAVLYASNKNKMAILRSGLEGEQAIANGLNALSDEYYVINNATIESKNRRTEIDSLVVSPYGVWVVEVKNYVGELSGEAKGEQWKQIKKSRSGERYRHQVRNPITQMHRQKSIVYEMLKENNISVPLFGYVVLPSADAAYIASDEIIMNIDALVKRICLKKDKAISDEKIYKILELFK